MGDVYFAKPCQSFGYYRGWPVYEGDGSEYGPEVQGEGEFSQGEGPIPTGDLDIPLSVVISVGIVAALIFAILCTGEQ